MKRINFLLYIFSAALLSSCEQENPLDIEQYRKEVYIVGASQSNNQALQVVKLPYTEAAETEVPAYISVALGGSKETDHDVDVSIAEAGTTYMDRYNFLYNFGPADVRYQYLASSFYRIPQTRITIKSGETYARMPIFIKTNGLKSDSLYALTFRVASVSEPDYVSIRKRDTVLMFSFSLNNQYSGGYQLQGSYTKDGSTNPADVASVSAIRNLKAVNFNTVRLIHTANGESLANAATLGVSVKVNPDNTLQLTPWGTFALLSGGGTYDPTEHAFNIWYTYKENNITYRFTGKYVKNAL